MALDSIGSDNSLKLSTIKPVTGIDTQLNVNVGAAVDKSSGNVSINKDGANVNSNKGRIPASGSIFGGSDTSPAAKNAESVINQYSGDKKQLQAFSKALDSIDFSKGLDGISDDTLNELLNLGFDISTDHGKIVIKDNNGNDVSVEDFMKMKDNLSNTVKRAIANIDSPSPTAKTSGVTSAQPTTEIKADAMMSDSQQKEMLNILKGYSDTTVHVNQVSNPMKEKLDNAIKDYEAKVSEVNKQSQKIDMSISQILSLRTQAESLISKSKTQPLSDVEKKQLQSLVSTIQLKQKELISNQQGNEVLMNQIDQVYSQFSGDLSPSEKETKDSMQAALKAKISGQSLTVRQNFLAEISEEAYKLTANMSPDELNKLSTDTSARVKMFSPVNKLLDRVNGAKTKADLSQQDIDDLWSKFKIKAVDENGALELYYYANGKDQPQKVSKDDLKVMRTDLNNMVSSPQLFTLSRASGQIAIAYDKNLAESANIAIKGDSSGADPVLQEQPKAKVEEKGSADKSETKDSKGFKVNLTNIDEEAKSRAYDQNQKSALDKSIEERREAEKYHEKQLEHIYDNRRQINKHLEQKRVEESNAKVQQDLKNTIQRKI